MESAKPKSPSEAAAPAAPRRSILEIAANAGAVFLGVVFLVAAWAKAIDPASFAEVIREEGLAFLLPAGVVAVLAIGLEVGLGVALVLRLRLTWVLAATTALVVFFLFLTGRAYVDSLGGGPSHSCGCFGNLVDRTPGEAFFQDAALLVPALVLAWFARPAGWGWPPPRRRGLAVAAATVVGMGFSIAAPGLPLDGLATRLHVGDRVDDLCAGKSSPPAKKEGEKGPAKPVCVPDILPDVSRGRHVIVIADLSDAAFKARVPDLNKYALDDRGPHLWVLTVETQEAIRQFSMTSGATFSTFEAPASLLRPLRRRLPRSFLVVDGKVEKIWDGLPPLDALSASAPG